MKRFIAAALCVALAACLLPVTALAEDIYISSTPVYNADSAQYGNIRRASNVLDGWYVPYGSAFSFNDAVGPRTQERGYVEAENGRGSVNMGGGVSQVATTLYLALLQAPGIYFDQISTYGSRFTGDYVSDGDLAIVTDYRAGTDFAFTNYYSDFVIHFSENSGYLTCEIVPVSQPATAQSGFGALQGGTRNSGQGRLIASASFSVSGSSGLINNITRAAENADGTVLHSGQVFSFNDVVGPRTEAYGFVSAINGRGVSVIGGGVAQVASVLWLAVKDAVGITVTEKSTYGSRYNQDYVSSADDAIVTDYGAGTDFAFRYDGSESLTIRVYVQNGTLYCEIYEGAGNAAPGFGTPSPAPANGGGLSW